MRWAHRGWPEQSSLYRRCEHSRSPVAATLHSAACVCVAHGGGAGVIVCINQATETQLGRFDTNCKRTPLIAALLALGVAILQVHSLFLLGSHSGASALHIGVSITQQGNSELHTTNALELDQIRPHPQEGCLHVVSSPGASLQERHTQLLCKLLALLCGHFLVLAVTLVADEQLLACALWRVSVDLRQPITHMQERVLHERRC